eukprot:Awhi_evm3s1279
MSLHYTLPSCDPHHCDTKFIPNKFRCHICQTCNQLWSQHASTTPEQATAAITKSSTSIGSFQSAINEPFLKTNDISAVITVARDLGSFFPIFGSRMPEVSKNLKHGWLQLDLNDSLDQNLSDEFGKGIEWLDETLNKGGRVLIHCAQGKSRSTSLIIAFMILKRGESYNDTLKHIKEKRPMAEPNSYFEMQLKQMEKTKQNR